MMKKIINLILAVSVTVACDSKFTPLLCRQIKDAVDFVVPPSVDTQSTGRASQIIKLGLRGEVEIIRK